MQASFSRVRTPNAPRAASSLGRVLLLALAAGTASAPAADDAVLPSAADVVRRMNEALTPSATMIAEVRLATDTGEDGVLIYDAHVARRAFDDGTRTTAVFTGGEPGFEDIVMLWGIQHDAQPAEAIFLPATGRVRTVVPVRPEDKLLRTDFTRADLGLVPDAPYTHSVLGRERVGHEPAYKLEAQAVDSTWFSRVVTWVSAETWLPLRRQYYDRAGRLWKLARYQAVLIDGRPTITSIVMDDLQTRTSSELLVRSVRYDTSPNAELFRETALAEVPQHPIWEGLRPRMQ